jgi:catechol 2,3-dioxygenase-like lactoylglutathione lyase family enzyme
MVKELHHVSILVKDMEKSLELYKDVLGMTLERDTGVSALEPYYAKYAADVTGIPCSNARFVYLKGFGIRIELQQFYGVKDEDSFFQFGKRGIRNHLALYVDNIHKAYKKLKKKYTFISSPKKIPEGPLKNTYAVYFLDPSGNQIELFQKPEQ